MADGLVGVPRRRKLGLVEGPSDVFRKCWNVRLKAAARARMTDERIVVDRWRVAQEGYQSTQ